MNFHLRVYDNYHYMDEEEVYDYGNFENYDEALLAAKSIVDEFFKQNWKPGINPNELLAQYSMYGEDPIILPISGHEKDNFSARSYAKTSVAEICKKLEDQ